MDIKPRKKEKGAVGIFDAADYLGISTRTVRRMIKEDEIEYFKTMKGNLRFDMSTLEKYRQESKNKFRKATEKTIPSMAKKNVSSESSEETEIMPPEARGNDEDEGITIKR